MIKEYGSAEGGRFPSDKYGHNDITDPCSLNRLARSEGSLQMNDQSRQFQFAKNPRYVRRAKGMQTSITRFEINLINGRLLALLDIIREIFQGRNEFLLENLRVLQRENDTAQ